ALAALRQVERWAIVRDLLSQPITTGVEFTRSHDGHKPWTDEQVQLAEIQARPELAQVVTLAANTGQRGSDLVKMRWTDIEVYNGLTGINVCQVKTGRQIWVPITQELSAAMAGWERRPGFILLRPTGIPWTRKALTWAWIVERDSNPALRPLAGLVLHGLRATACVRLLRAGANTRQIADMVGMSEPIVGRYCRFSVQRENASAAVLHVPLNLALVILGENGQPFQFKDLRPHISRLRAVSFARSSVQMRATLGRGCAASPAKAHDASRRGYE